MHFLNVFFEMYKVMISSQYLYWFRSNLIFFSVHLFWIREYLKEEEED